VKTNLTVGLLLRVLVRRVRKPIGVLSLGGYGGYAGSNSWTISSGIEEMIDRGDHWEIPNHSGSVYYCYKSAERFSMLTGSIYSNYAKDNSEEHRMVHIPIGEPECDTGL